MVSEPGTRLKGGHVFFKAPRAILSAARAARTAFYKAMTKHGVLRKRKGKRDG